MMSFQTFLTTVFQQSSTATIWNTCDLHPGGQEHNSLLRLNITVFSQSALGVVTSAPRSTEYILIPHKLLLQIFLSLTIYRQILSTDLCGTDKPGKKKP